jgi:transcriptional regulator of NAD metabolism
MTANSRPAKRPPAPVPANDAGDDRRRRIVEWMQRAHTPVSGTELADHFEVSRQCIVQDIAILRAGGTEILATPRGYRLPDLAPLGHREIIACNHPPERTEEELQILVDHGVKVLDVIVEHQVYGDLRGSLMLESRADIQDFLQQMRLRQASLLSSLTGGVHLHTVEAHRAEMVSRAKAQLRERGFLLK